MTFDKKNFFVGAVAFATIILGITTCITITSILGNHADERMMKACTNSGGSWTVHAVPGSEETHRVCDRKGTP